MAATWVQLAAEGGDVIFHSVTASFSGSFSGSISGTASSATNADTASVAPRYTLTSSFNTFSSSYVNDSASFNTRINQVTNATGGFVTTQSFQAFTQSMQSFTSSITSQVNLIAATYATTASNLFRGNQIVSGSITVTDTITAQRLVVQTITSSIIYSSGSNIFGDDLSDTQQFTGSVSVTGSLALNGSQVILTNQTSSMSVLFAQSASYVESVQTASEAPKYTLTASFQPFTQSMHTFTQSINQTVTNVYASQSNYTTTASFNAFTASTNTSIANVYSSQSNYTLTSSFNTFSSSYLTDSGSFNSRITTNSASFSTFSGS